MNSRILPTMHPRIPLEYRAEVEAAIKEDPDRYCGKTSRPFGHPWRFKCNRPYGHESPVHVAVGMDRAEWAWEEPFPPNTPEEKSERRQARLLKLLTYRAPTNIIDAECLLVLAAHHGGRLGTIRWLFRELIVDRYQWHLQGAQQWLHDFGEESGLPIHFRHRDVPCWICAVDKGDCCGGPE